MAEAPITIKLGGQTFIRTSDMKVKTLSKSDLDVTGLTLKDESGTNYQVPTGKVLKILELYCGASSTSKVYTIFSATVADSATDEIDKIVNSIGIDTFSPKINVDIDIAVDLFVNGKVSSATGQDSITVIGIEMDA